MITVRAVIKQGYMSMSRMGLDNEPADWDSSTVIFEDLTEGKVVDVYRSIYEDINVAIECPVAPKFANTDEPVPVTLKKQEPIQTNMMVLTVMDEEKEKTVFQSMKRKAFTDTDGKTFDKEEEALFQNAWAQNRRKSIKLHESNEPLKIQAQCDHKNIDTLASEITKKVATEFYRPDKECTVSCSYEVPGEDDKRFTVYKEVAQRLGFEIKKTEGSRCSITIKPVLRDVYSIREEPTLGETWFLADPKVRLEKESPPFIEGKLSVAAEAFQSPDFKIKTRAEGLIDWHGRKDEHPDEELARYVDNKMLGEYGVVSHNDECRTVEIVQVEKYKNKIVDDLLKGVTALQKEKV